MITFLSLILLAQTISQASSHPKNIFLLASGRGGLINGTWDGSVPPKCRPNPSILRLSANLTWVPATEPLHKDIDVNVTVGVGPGMSFANSLLDNDSSLRVVGLVPCAVGGFHGTKISQWVRGSFLYEQLVKRARAALLGGGKIQAMLWYQGESDTVEKEDAELYKGRLEMFFLDVRSDLQSPSLPIIQAACLGPDLWDWLPEKPRSSTLEMNQLATWVITDLSASSRVVHTLGINNRRISSKYHQTLQNPLRVPTLLSCSCRKSFNFRSNSSQIKKQLAASESSLQHNSSQKQLAVLLEVEGVLMDVYRLGNRQAFNAAFRKLGLDCANWTEPIYLDLLRKSTGDEEMMLILYFNRIGWPSSLPTSEKETFSKSVLREKKAALDDLVLSKSLPLRPGVEEFIDEACGQGIPVVILTAYSSSSDKIARSIVEKLGEDRISKIKMVGNDEVERSFYGQLVLGKGVSSGLDEQLAEEASKAASAEKQRIAEEVASMLKLSVDIDTSSPETLKKIVVAQRAGAEYAGVPVYKCVLVSGSQSGIAGAEQIGMPCIVLRSSLTSRAEFPSARATMDGFGGADLTVSRLWNMS